MKKPSFSAPYAAAVISAFFLLFLNFNALYKYGSGYDKRILIVNFLFFLVWAIVYAVGKKSKFPLYGIITSSLIFISINIFFCKNYFDNFAGTLDAATLLSNGRVSMDLLFHAAIAESIVNYYTPSILVNNLESINYHFSSHFIVALFSKITQVPPFFVYNYIYPQISVTFFMYLYFRLIQTIGNHFSCNQFISTLTGCILLLLQLILSDSLLIMVRSQSFFVSIIFSLLYFNILEKYNLYSIITNRNHILIFNIITLSFIFIISITKTSTGLIFLALCSWFYLRLPQSQWKKITILFLYSLFYLAALTLCLDMNEGGSEVKIQNITFPMKHLLIILPCIVSVAIIIGLKKIFSKNTIKELVKQKKAVLEECLLIGLILCFLLSLVLVRHWILYYFTISLSFFAILVGFFLLAEFYLPNIKYHIVKYKYFSIVLFIMLLCILLPSLGQNFKAFSTLFLTIKYQRSVQAGTKNIHELLSFKKYFSKSRFFDSKLYRIIWTIREISGNNKNEYGLYVSNNNSFKIVRPVARVFFYQGLTGIVRYAPLYKTDKGIFSSSGNLVSDDLAYSYYAIHKIDIPPSVNLDYAQCMAKADGKKFLFYIDHDNLYLINLETNTSELVKLSSP